MTNIAKIFFSQRKNKKGFIIFSIMKDILFTYLEFFKSALVALGGGFKTFAPK